MCVEILETIGVSPKSWEDAVTDALIRYPDREVTGADVLGFTADVKNGKIIEYRTNVKLAYKV